MVQELKKPFEDRMKDIAIAEMAMLLSIVAKEKEQLEEEIQAAIQVENWETFGEWA